MLGLGSIRPGARRAPGLIEPKPNIRPKKLFLWLACISRPTILGLKGVLGVIFCILGSYPMPICWVRLGPLPEARSSEQLTALEQLTA